MEETKYSAGSAENWSSNRSLRISIREGGGIDLSLRSKSSPGSLVITQVMGSLLVTSLAEGIGTMETEATRELL